jgi:hypothetical protein
MFGVKDTGVVLRNTLYTIWLSYTTRAIRHVDDKVLETMRRIKNEEIPAYKEEDVISANNNANENTLLDIYRMPDDKEHEHKV